MSNPLSGYAYMARRALEQNFNERVDKLERELSSCMAKLAEYEVRLIVLEHQFKTKDLMQDSYKPLKMEG